MNDKKKLIVLIIESIIFLLLMVNIVLLMNFKIGTIKEPVEETTFTTQNTNLTYQAKIFETPVITKIVIGRNYSFACGDNLTLSSTTCECAKNTSTPCMAMCYECR